VALLFTGVVRPLLKSSDWTAAASTAIYNKRHLEHFPLPLLHCSGQIDALHSPPSRRPWRVRGGRKRPTGAGETVNSLVGQHASSEPPGQNRSTPVPLPFVGQPKLPRDQNNRRIAGHLAVPTLPLLRRPMVRVHPRPVRALPLDAAVRGCNSRAAGKAITGLRLPSPRWNAHLVFALRGKTHGSRAVSWLPIYARRAARSGEFDDLMHPATAAAVVISTLTDIRQSRGPKRSRKV